MTKPLLLVSVRALAFLWMGSFLPHLSSCALSQSPEKVELKQTASGQYYLGDETSVGIDTVRWRDNESIIYRIESFLVCFDLKSKKNLWKKNFGETIHSIDIHEGKIVVSLSGRRIYILDSNSGDKISEVSNEKLTELIGYGSNINFAFMVTSGKIGVVVQGNRFGKNFHLVEIEPFQVTASYLFDLNLWNVRLTNDRKFVSSATTNGSISVRRIRTGTKIFQLGDPVKTRFKGLSTDGLFRTAPFFSEKHQIAISVNSTGWGKDDLSIWKENGQLINAIEVENGYSPIDVDDINQQIALLDNNLTLFDFNGKQIVKQKSPLKEVPFCVRFSPNGGRVFLGDTTSFAVVDIVRK